MLATEELDRAVRGVEERVQIWRRARDRTLLRDCVLAWCESLGWAPEVADFAMSMDRAHAAHLVRIAIRFESEVRQHKVSASKVACYAYLAKRVRADPKDYTDVSDEAMSKMEPRDYILIALAIAAAGYVVYRLTRRPQRPVEAPPVTTNVVPTRWVLVLVINAGRESVIDALRSGGVAALEGDQLYRATQALWLGPEAEFRRSNLSEWFSESRAVPEPSEYDVHLVRVELSSDDPGLHRNANQMDRLDAFRRFQSMGFKATVSPRLPSDAYGTTDVYSR
jgi:hypothetical protein